MAIVQHDFINTWEEGDLVQLPTQEDATYEFKSSQTSLDRLGPKLGVAASAFWNSGGGVFVAGVNDVGKVDGGVPEIKGNQALRDWVDRMLAGVVPAGPYTVKLISPATSASAIHPGRVVLVVSFGESFDGPHMAPDNKYYVRAGAHSNPATHFIVEAIRARRGVRDPMLRGVLRMSEHNPGVVELVILTLSQPALDVTVDFDPLPIHLGQHFRDHFPLHIPLVDREYPFIMEVSTFRQAGELFGMEPVILRLSYRSIVGRKFEEQQEIDIHRGMAPMKITVNERKSR